MSVTPETNGAAPLPGEARTPACTPAVARPTSAKKNSFFGLDNRFLAPLLITLILVVGQLAYGVTEIYSSPLLARLTFGLVSSYSPTFIAILSAIALELVLGRLVLGKWPHLASAYISGISVGILIRGPDLWPYILCSLITIASKYAIRVRGRHLWNPSNFGVTIVFYLAPWSAYSLSVHWGNELWPMLIIWCLGCLILYRLGRLHITLTYAAAFVLLACVRSAVTGDTWLVEVAPITGPMYQLFIFFMITDPKTTTRTRGRQCAVAVLVAIVETMFRLRGEVHAPYFALFFVGPVTNLLEIWWDARRAAPRAGPGTPSAGKVQPAPDLIKQS